QADRLHCARDLRRHAAHGWHEGGQDHHRHQQGSRGAYLQARRPGRGRRRPQDRAAAYPGSSLAQRQVMATELSLLAVQPHPDDESIGMGGTLARYSAEGVRTTLVTATRGEVGEILDKDLDPKEAAPRLATIREGELRNALKILGVNELVFLGYEDSGMAGLPRNREPQTFWRADEEEAIGRLVQVVRRVRPQVMVTQNEFGGYAHPDHIQTHRVAIGAFYYAGDVKRFPGGEAFRPSKLYYSAFPKSLMRQMPEAMRRARAGGAHRHRLRRRGRLGGKRHPALSRRRRTLDQVRSVQGGPHRHLPKGSGPVLDVQPQPPPPRCRAQSGTPRAGRAGATRPPAGGGHPEHRWPASTGGKRPGGRAAWLIARGRLPGV